MLDGHHLVENRARFGAGLLFNFSGTGGIWRREAILSAGSWQHDTLTEDLDLSYRAQLAGWKFIYREDVVSPSELPEDCPRVRAQQFRWAKGTVQTARKLLRRVLSSHLTFQQRIEAFFHMTPHFAYPLMVLLSVMLLPALVLMPATNTHDDAPRRPAAVHGDDGLARRVLHDGRVGAGATALGRAGRGCPMLLALGAGLAPHLTQGRVRGLAVDGRRVRPHAEAGASTRAATAPAADLPLLETALSRALPRSRWSPRCRRGTASPPRSRMLFTFGYGYVAVLVVSEQATRRREAMRRPPPTSVVASARISEAPPASGERGLTTCGRRQPSPHGPSRVRPRTWPRELRSPVGAA